MKRNFLAVFTTAAAVGFLALACADQPTAVEDSLAPGDAVLGTIGTPNKQDWKQCRNNNDRNSECSWITGNLNATHNTYFEGDMVPKALRIPGIQNGGAFEVVMTYGFMKAGKTTHDFLGQWNLDMINANPCTDGSYSGFCTGGALNAISTSSNSMAALSQAAVNAACSGRPDLQTAMANAIAAVNPANLVIEAINFQTVNVTNITFTGCPISGDAEAFLTMTVTPNAAGVSSGHGLLLFGAHVARGFDWPNGGASSVSGSPYHLGLVSVDGKSAGSMDLQMAAAAVVVPATITVEKVCTSGTATFSYTGTVPGGGALAPFDLDCGEDLLVVEGTDFGQYTITESALAGWQLTDLECTGGGGNTSVNVGTATATVGLDEGENVVCTFTNEPQPQVRVRKVFDPTTDGGLVSFDVGGNADDNSGSGYGHNGTTQFYLFPIGTNVSFSEAGFGGTDLGDYESSWACDNGASGSGTSGSTGALAAGDAVTCTFTNARKPEVRVRKVFDPTTDGGLVSFDVGGNADDNSAAGYGHNGTTQFYQFAIGANVSFSEAGFGGTDLGDYESSWACDNSASGSGTSGSTGALAAGDQVTCTFTNARKPEVRVRKVFDPTTDGGLVSFDVGGNADDNSGAGYGHNGTTQFYQFAIGANVSFSEAGFGGTDLLNYTSSWACDNGASGLGTSGSTGALGAGDQVTCTFTNVRLPEESETAWASNQLGVPLQLPYGGGNWATYVAYSGVAKTTTLFAGQTMDVGTVHFSAPAGGLVTITITLAAGWTFEAGSVVAVQDYAVAPSGNPSPGQFDHKQPAGTSPHVIVVPQNNFYGVHAVVVGN